MTKPHVFQESLARSHAAEDLPFWEECYRNAFRGFVAMHGHRQDGQHQRNGIDRSVVLDNGVTYWIDEKVRGRNAKTGKVYGDILLEAFSDEQRGTFGWARKPLMCHYIAYAIAPLGKCYLLPVPQLQAAWRKHGAAWMITFGIRRAENTSWTTASVPVPVSVLFKAINGMLQPTFTPHDLTN